MARTKAELSAGARLADCLMIGFLAVQCPVGKVRQTLEKNGAQSKRRRGLPHEVLVYFVMMMVLYADVAYEDVMRLVVEGLRTSLGETGLESTVVTKGAISQARGLVGEAPLRQLYEEQVRPHGPPDMPGVMFHGHRVMAIDGSTLTMPDEKANSDFYGHLGGGYGDAAFPVIRFVGMTECGTHTICFAKHGPFKEGELTLAQSVMDHADKSNIQLWCKPGGLVLDPFAGSGTTGHAVLDLNAETGADRRFILIEQENTEKGDHYVSTLTVERVKRVITAQLASGPCQPLASGFRFIELKREKIDAEAVNALAREEMIDLLLTSYWDKNEKTRPYLRRLPAGSHRHLFAVNPKDEGFFLIWDAPDQKSALNRDAFKRIVEEAKAANLATRYHIYASLASALYGNRHRVLQNSRFCS